MRTAVDTTSVLFVADAIEKFASLHPGAHYWPVFWSRFGEISSPVDIDHVVSVHIVLEFPQLFTFCGYECCVTSFLVTNYFRCS